LYYRSGKKSVTFLYSAKESPGKDQTSPGGDIYLPEQFSDSKRQGVERTNLQAIPSPVPLHRRSKVFGIQVDIVKAAEISLVAAQHSMILPRFFHSNPIIGIALCRVEVEDEQQAGSLVYNHLVLLVLQRHVCLGQMEVKIGPSCLAFVLTCGEFNQSCSCERLFMAMSKLLRYL
jgi:hypothetical protein